MRFIYSLLSKIKTSLIKIRQYFVPAKRRRRLLLLIFGLIIISLLLSFNHNSKTKISSVGEVAKGEVKKEISITGKVKPAAAVDLALEKGGKIRKINVILAEEVKKNQILLQLDSSDIYAQLKQAEANLKFQEAKLEELKKGSRPEEINISQIQLDKTQNDLNNYYQEAINTLNNVYNTANGIVKQQISSLAQYVWNFSKPYYDLTFRICDENAKRDALSQKKNLDKVFDEWQNNLQNISSLNFQTEQIDQLIIQSKDNLNLVKSFLDKLNAALILNCSLNYYETLALNQNQAILNTALNNLSTIINTLTTLEKNLNGQKLTVQNYEEQLALKKAGATEEQIKAQEAQVEQAKASVLYYQALLEKYILKAPFDAKVTKIDVNEGDIVSANSPLISLIGQGQLQIEVYIPESDIAEIKIGQPANATLDAYGSEVIFSAHIAQIDLSATILEGVATYKTILQFDNKDDRILPGLTANVEILVAKKDNVLYLPSRYIITKNDKKYVKLVVKEQNSAVETEIQTGLRGSDGRTEIISGLKEGDKVAFTD